MAAHSGGGHAFASGKVFSCFTVTASLFAADKSRLEAQAMNMSHGRFNPASISCRKHKDVAALSPVGLLQSCQGPGYMYSSLIITSKVFFSHYHFLYRRLLKLIILTIQRIPCLEIDIQFNLYLILYENKRGAEC